MTSSDAFGIYVHWPFCKAKCPYCDFNSHVRHEGVDALSFAKAHGTELAWFAQRTPGRPSTRLSGVDSFQATLLTSGAIADIVAGP